MKQFVGIVTEGIEDIAAQEVNGQKKERGRILFSQEKKEYSTIDAIYECEEEFSFEIMEDILAQVKKRKWRVIPPFRVTCRREGNHLFRATDIERDCGEIIYKQGHAVDLKNPKTTLFVDIRDKKCAIGKLLHKDLQKRSYRVRRNSAGISATLAAALIKIAKAAPEESIYDPYCKDAVIAIEAVRQGATHVYATDPLENNLRNAKINAKMAKADITWNAPEAVDKLITNYWVSAKQERAKEQLIEFLRKAVSLVKNKMVILTNWRGLEREIHDAWSIEEKRMIMRGAIKNYIFCLKRKDRS